MPEVDIITTTYSGNTVKLKKCIDSVVENTKYVDYKWYLWCNNPDDKLKKVVNDACFLDGIRFNTHIEPIYTDTNDGSFSSNNNECVEEGSSKYILFLNDDVEVLREDWLLNMKTIVDKDPKVGAVGSLLLYPDKTIQHAGVFFSERTNNLPFHIFYKKPMNNFIKHNRYYQAVTGACMLVRRKDFETLGGFDCKFIYGYEDVALCLRLSKHLGRKIVYCASSMLVHHEGVSGKFKKHPNLQNNIKVFREHYQHMCFNDLEFYQSNPKFMIYK